ncbi:MAG: polysaccharide pyruvyl transferase family protein [Desulfurococcaceae archaeon]|nr:polysaccharide pyruvyl transferase family protein [Desulfurococcaceae archaeon]
MNFASNVKIFVISNLGSGSFGDELNLLGVLYKYRRYKPIRLTIVANEPQIFREYHPILGKHASIIKSNFVFGFISVIPPLLRSNLVITTGGKYMKNLYEIFYLAYIALLGKLLRRKILLESIGIYPYGTRVGFNIEALDKELNSYKLGLIRLLLTKLLLALADRVSVRDISSKILINLIIGKKVLFEIDPIFNLPINDTNSLLQDESHLLLGLAIGYVIDKRFLNLMKELYKAIVYLMKQRPRLKIICVPFSIPTIKDLKSPDNDLRLCLQLYAHLPDELKAKFVVVKERLKPIEAIQLLRKLDCIVALRYHPFLLAIKLGVPCLIIPHELKVLDYINILTKYKLRDSVIIGVVTPDTVSSHEIVAYFERCIDNISWVPSC